MEKKLTIILLVLIFLLALALRFLYFPGNIYFGFDQARDAFTSLQLLSGHLKIVGPPTSIEGLFHGALYYYLYAPLYFIFGGDPTYAAAVLRLINAATIFLVFGAGWAIFNKRVGLLAAFLFAISFEQSQYALYFNHPSLAPFSITVLYLGLSLLFFRQKQWGLVLAFLGLGLSLQFEFVLIYLFAILIVLLIIFRKHLSKVSKQTFFYSVIALLISTSTFVIAEIKFNFRVISHLSSIFSVSQGSSAITYFSNISLLGQRFVNDNLLSFSPLTKVLAILITLTSTFFLTKKEAKFKIIFLLIWIFGGIIPYLNNKSADPIYYYSVGAGVGLLILVSFFLSQLIEKFGLLVLVLLIIPLISNFNLIKNNNPRGVIPSINVQSGMLLGEEKQAVDFIYQQADNEQFAVKALTMPLSVNTTWSYLFEWYGQKKYRYLPLWVGPNALGFPGNLKVIDARSNLPKQQFLIIEPTRGIRGGLIDNFMEQESYFTKIVEEKKFGDIIVQRREPL